MKKKIISLFSGVLLAALVFAVFAACGNDSRNSSDSKNHLTYEKKYFYTNAVNNDPNYFNEYYLFHRDNTGEAVYYLNDSYSYTITFKYTLVKDESVFCFYDSVTYADEHAAPRSAVRPDWSEQFLFSPDILYSSDCDIYFCETYLPEIPNFNRSSSEN